MNSMEEKILPCKCGSDARVRYRLPYYWVECKKKCGMKTGFHLDVFNQCNPKAKQEAIEEWNRLVRES